MLVPPVSCWRWVGGRRGSSNSRSTDGGTLTQWPWSCPPSPREPQRPRYHLTTFPSTSPLHLSPPSDPLPVIAFSSPALSLLHLHLLYPLHNTLTVIVVHSILCWWLTFFLLGCHFYGDWRNWVVIDSGRKFCHQENRLGVNSFCTKNLHLTRPQSSKNKIRSLYYRTNKVCIGNKYK